MLALRVKAQDIEGDLTAEEVHRIADEIAGLASDCVAKCVAMATLQCDKPLHTVCCA